MARMPRHHPVAVDAQKSKQMSMKEVPGNRGLLMLTSLAQKSEQQMAIIGYGRVSTDGQSLQSQTEALHLAGASRVYTEKLSGAYADRPQLAKAIQALGNGDTLIVLGPRHRREGLACVPR